MWPRTRRLTTQQDWIECRCLPCRSCPASTVTSTRLQLKRVLRDPACAQVTLVPFRGRAVNLSAPERRIFGKFSLGTRRRSQFQLLRSAAVLPVEVSLVGSHHSECNLDYFLDAANQKTNPWKAYLLKQSVATNASQARLQSIEMAIVSRGLILGLA